MRFITVSFSGELFKKFRLTLHCFYYPMHSHNADSELSRHVSVQLVLHEHPMRDVDLLWYT